MIVHHSYKRIHDDSSLSLFNNHEFYWHQQVLKSKSHDDISELLKEEEMLNVCSCYSDNPEGYLFELQKISPYLKNAASTLGLDLLQSNFFGVFGYTLSSFTEFQQITQCFEIISNFSLLSSDISAQLLESGGLLFIQQNLQAGSNEIVICALKSIKIIISEDTCRQKLADALIIDGIFDILNENQKNELIISLSLEILSIITQYKEASLYMQKYTRLACSYLHKRTTENINSLSTILLFTARQCPCTKEEFMNAQFAEDMIFLLEKIISDECIHSLKLIISFLSIRFQYVQEALFFYETNMISLFFDTFVLKKSSELIPEINFALDMLVRNIPDASKTLLESDYMTFIIQFLEDGSFNVKASASILLSRLVIFHPEIASSEQICNAILLSLNLLDCEQERVISLIIDMLIRICEYETITNHTEFKSYLNSIQLMESLTQLLELNSDNLIGQSANHLLSILMEDVIF